MHVGFLPFLPGPVAECDNVFSAIKNFTQRVGELKRDALPLFCDEGVFRIIVDTFFKS